MDKRDFKALLDVLERIAKALERQNVLWDDISVELSEIKMKFGYFQQEQEDGIDDGVESDPPLP